MNSFCFRSVRRTTASNKGQSIEQQNGHSLSAGEEEEKEPQRQNHGLVRFKFRPGKYDDRGLIMLSLATVGLTLLAADVYFNPVLVGLNSAPPAGSLESWIPTREWLPKPGAFSRTIATIIGIKRRQYDGETAAFDGKREIADWPGCAQVGDPEELVMSKYYRQQKSTMTSSTTRGSKTFEKELDRKSVKSPRKTSSNARILITGAASFLGYYTIEAMNRKQQRRVIAVDDFRNSPSFDDDTAMKRYRATLLKQQTSVDIQQLDVCSSTDELRALLKEEVSHVIHFDDPLDSPRSTGEYVKRGLQRRFECYERLLATIREVTAKMPFSIPVLYLSSGKTVEVNDAKVGTTSNLGMLRKHKAALERISWNHYQDYGVPSLALRAHNLFGPFCPAVSPLRKLGETILLGEDPTRITFPSLNFLHVTDFARAVIDVLWVFDAKDPVQVFSGLSVDLGAGDSLAKGELVELLQAARRVSNAAKLIEAISVETGTVYSVDAYQKGLGAHVQLSDTRKQMGLFAHWLNGFLLPKGYLLTTYPTSPKSLQWQSYNETGKGLVHFYEAAHKFDIPTVILHDGLQESFTNQHHTSRIIFVHINSLYQADEENLMNMQRSANERRFFYFSQYMARLKSFSKPRSLPKYILLADLLSTRLWSNPFQFFERAGHRNFLVETEGSRFGQDPVVTEQLKSCGFSKEQQLNFHSPSPKEILKPGFLGGKWETIEEFLRLFRNDISKFNLQANCDKVLVNYVCYQHFGGRLVKR